MSMIESECSVASRARRCRALSVPSSRIVVECEIEQPALRRSSARFAFGSSRLFASETPLENENQLGDPPDDDQDEQDERRRAAIRRPQCGRRFGARARPAVASAPAVARRRSRRDAAAGCRARQRDLPLGASAPVDAIGLLVLAPSGGLGYPRGYEREPRHRGRPRRDEDPRGRRRRGRHACTSTVERPTVDDLAGRAARRARRGRARAAARRTSAPSGSASRRGSTTSTGSRSAPVNIPLRDVAVPRRDAASGSACPSGWRTTRTCAALAEFALGAGRGTRDLVMLTLGTGVGGGVVVDGQLYRGWTELGHMVIVEDGEPCQGACTGHGHVEAYCSGPRGRQARAAACSAPARPRTTSSRRRHPALDARSAGTSASAIGSLVNIFGPERVVIGGGFGVAAGRAPAPGRAARRCCTRGARAGRARSSRSCSPQLGAQAGLIGAGLVAFEALEQ